MPTLRDTADTVERTAPMAAVSVFVTALCPEFSQDKAKSNRAQRKLFRLCGPQQYTKYTKTQFIYINPKTRYSFVNFPKNMNCSNV